MRFGTDKNLNKDPVTRPLRLSGGSDNTTKSSNEPNASGLMALNKHGAERSRRSKGTTSYAFGDLKSALDKVNSKKDELLGATGGERLVGHSLLYFAISGLAFFLTLELVITKQGTKLHAKADVRNK